ncbi:MAG: hypothetical protein KIS62_12320 [Ramlibacter sp.]|nr:hypothetical protein [Ramlibacter sp.]MCW5650523.1 hypothetical protein [Ramlibacter sp.]
MRAYLITVTQASGAQARYSGLYADGFDAVVHALEQFPGARRVGAQRVLP